MIKRFDINPTTVLTNAGLAGEKIVVQARIIAVADSYDAMTTNRVYGKTLSEDEAIDEIRRCSGTQFDPAIVNVLIELVSRKEDRA